MCMYIEIQIKNKNKKITAYKNTYNNKCTYDICKYALSKMTHVYVYVYVCICIWKQYAYMYLQT